MIDIARPMGQRISELRLTRTGEPIAAGRDYVVAGWASVNADTQGPPIWDVVANHIAGRGVVAPAASGPVRVTGE
jgi:sulfur-oxidizing protein SoxB